MRANESRESHCEPCESREPGCDACESAYCVRASESCESASQGVSNARLSNVCEPASRASHSARHVSMRASV